MDKIKIGIPRGLFYYYYIDIWHFFFEELGYEIIESPKTNKQILDDGRKYSNNNICLAFQIYMGHIVYLLDKCDYLLIPKVNNYGIPKKACDNFLGAYDMVRNIFAKPILIYNINLRKNKLKGLEKISKQLNKKKRHIRRAYKIAQIKYHKKLKKEILLNYSKLSSSKIKILMVSYPYNIYDNYLGMPIIKCLEKHDVEIIYADKFDTSVTNKLAKSLLKKTPLKSSRELIGAIKLIEGQIDGVIFLSCAQNTFLNELVINKIKIPYLNIIINNKNLLIEIENFIDMIKKGSK